ncbi:MAG: hypothetical protein OHK0045_07590 [Raineya sp.]
MLFIIIGILLVGISVGLWFYRKSQLEKSFNIRYQETANAKNIWDNYQDIVKVVGNGNYSEIVEVKGIGITDNPLIGEYSEKPVLYYRTSLIHEYEVQEKQRDSNGNTSWVTVRKSETIATNEQASPFYIDDNSGKKIMVNMSGAEKVIHKIVDRFEKEFSQNYLNQNRNTSWGGQLINFINNINTGSSRTIGYRFVEEAIPVNTRLYVYGEASDRDGELMIVKPKDAKQNFIVSVKSEEELIKDADSTARNSLIGVIILAVLGVASIIYGMVAKG